MLSTKCYQAKAGQLNRHWYVIDAKDQVVGRLAAQIAPILMGKHRPTYTPHIDTGDYVIVVNVEKVVFTGNKWDQKVYQRYSGYPGGQKEFAAWRVLESHPERILYEAVRRMMPKNKIGRHMLDKLKLVVGPDHPHQAQQPIPLEPLNGRPTADGILLAPKPSPPKPRARKPRRDESAPAVAEAPISGTESEAPTETAEAVETHAEAVAASAPEVESAAPPAEPEAEAPATTPETEPEAPPATGEDESKPRPE